MIELEMLTLNSTKQLITATAEDESISWFRTRLSAKLSSAVPLWNRTVSSVVVVEMRRPTFLLITTHRDSKICKTGTVKKSAGQTGEA